jgi:uncharacterized protein (TIGR03067 family)
MKTILTLLGTALLVAAQDPPKPDAKAEMKKMEGTWTFEKSVANGMEGIPAEDLKKARLYIKGDKRTIKVEEEVLAESQYTLDPSSKPKKITIKVLTGGLEGKELKGIYELEGDTLKIAVGLEGEMPKDFESKEGSNVLLQVFKRVKEKKQSDN